MKEKTDQMEQPYKQQSNFSLIAHIHITDRKKTRVIGT